MAFVALNLSDTVDFQSSLDPNRGKEGAAIFKIGAIPTRIFAKIKDQGSNFVLDDKAPGGVNAEFTFNDTATEMVRYGLKGIKGFKDGNGNDLEYKTQKMKVGNSLVEALHDDLMDVLPLELIRELAMEINVLCEVPDAVKKKSDK